jgi:hypothetical protein
MSETVKTLKEVQTEIQNCEKILAETRIAKENYLRDKETETAKNQVWILSKSELDLETRIAELKGTDPRINYSSGDSSGGKSCTAKELDKAFKDAGVYDNYR